MTLVEDRLTTYASRSHYAAHLEPVARLIRDVPVTLIASYADLVKARSLGAKRIVLMQHGIGQSYSDTNPAYPGGRDNHDVGLFLCPNEHSANRWRAAYPKAAVAVVGVPRLDTLPLREPGPTTVAITFHWQGGSVPETTSAFDHFQRAVVQLSHTVNVIGHAHPRASRLPLFYQKHGIPFVADFDDVCRRADLLVFDNTSAGYEFAATGRPVIVLDSPEYRRDVEHGLRFWDAAHVGYNARPTTPLDLLVDMALVDDIPLLREDALKHVFAYREGAARRAAEAIHEWAS